jgi:hypothetical protein
LDGQIQAGILPILPGALVLDGSFHEAEAHDPYITVILGLRRLHEQNGSHGQQQRNQHAFHNNLPQESGALPNASMMLSLQVK